MRFERFPSIAAMSAWAAAYAKALDYKTWAEPTTYTDNHGLTYRPSVILVSDEGEAVCLRWFAYADEADIDCMGKRARREAFEKAEWYVEQVQSAINEAV